MIAESKVIKEVKMQNAQYITTIIFCIILFITTAATIISHSSEFSEVENRVLTQSPKVGFEDILSGKFESNYEKYLADQFVFRNYWGELKTYIEILLLKREIKDIYFANDDYLIERHAGVFSTETARNNALILAQFVHRYKGDFDRGRLSVIIVPNAVNIFTDKLPPYAPFNNAEKYLSDIEESLPESTLLNTTQILIAHSNEELYYRTDHHWRTLAAFYVYQSWVKEQGYLLPELKDYKIETVSHEFEGTIQSKLGISVRSDTIEIFSPLNDVAFTIQGGGLKNLLYDYSTLQTKDKYAVFLGGNYPFLKIHTEAGSKRKILVIKDSYANCFIPFMLKDFTDIDVLDLRYSRQRVSRLISEGGYTDLLVLYNAAGFAEDTALNRLLF